MLLLALTLLLAFHDLLVADHLQWGVQGRNLYFAPDADDWPALAWLVLACDLCAAVLVLRCRRSISLGRRALSLCIGARTALCAAWPLGAMVVSGPYPFRHMDKAPFFHPFTGSWTWDAALWSPLLHPGGGILPALGAWLLVRLLSHHTRSEQRLPLPGPVGLIGVPPTAG
jgi:hypothetical protein